MKKIFFVTTCFISLVLISVAITSFDVPKYKNLKILPKNISKEELDSTMHFYSASLGVRCSFCHVRNEEKKEWDFASDEKSDKLIARKMMLMANGINKKYFKEVEEGNNKQNIPTITCYSCHHGEALPVSIPLRKSEGNRENNRPVTDSTIKIHD